MSHNARHNLKESLREQDMRGTSKRKDREKQKIATENRSAKAKGIHSHAYFNQCLNRADCFADWLKESNIPLKTLEEIKPYAAEYLKEFQNSRSASTARSQLARCFNCDSEELLPSNQLPGRPEITKNRTDTATQIKYNNDITNLYNVSVSLGLRHEEMDNLCVQSFYFKEDSLYVTAVGKGGLHIDKPVIVNESTAVLKEYIISNSDEPEKPIFSKHKEHDCFCQLPSDYNNHRTRQQHAAAAYDYAKNNGLFSGELYHTHDGTKRIFDKGGLSYVNKMLGHGDDRCYTAVYNYLYNYGIV